MEVSVKAPGVLKLLGEHAVIYGHLAVAVAIDRYVTAKAKIEDAPDTIVILDDLHKSFRFTREELMTVYRYYITHPLKSMDDVGHFIQEWDIANEDPEALPYAIIAARLSHQYGVNMGGLRVKISSDIPIKKGYASSAACFTAFAVAAQSADDSKLADADLLDVAMDGERIMHKNPGAGRIDVSTSYYGGVVSVQKGREPFARKEQVSRMPEIVVIDTGPKKSTEETVGHIRELREANQPEVDAKLAEIGRLSERGLAALIDGRFEELGICMNGCQRLLADLGVSSNGLDVAIHRAREAGAWGAKLSGGGGGGVAVAISADPDDLLVKLRFSRLNVSVVGISQYGAYASTEAKLPTGKMVNK